MSDIGKLRKVVAETERIAMKGSVVGWWLNSEGWALRDALTDYLALLESDAIVVRRDGGGNWPQWAILAIYNGPYTEHPADVLDALAAASKASE